ncbi:MAG: dTDP-4-dehydrorhamnose 3,5-epimerase family protein, partial [Bacteroidetes bacterium]|nr:dTDP-4-dehydrorhamnose 3,5-epimerase family protein [Fibrella sp.]
TQGQILDVIVDLRRQSPAYRQYVTLELNELGDSVYIPKGCAHGFLSRTTTATVVYTVSTVYNQAADAGIRWDSFGFDWGVGQPIVSARDAGFGGLIDFDSPF